MRIIGGRLGGQNFSNPKGHNTHPMSEKARGSIFNSLGDIEGMDVLDAFAGTGALGFEAISRGAKSAVAVELDKNTCVDIKENAQKLGIDNLVKVIRANVSGWSDNNHQQEFDLILCDPPYDNLQTSKVVKLTRHLKNNGIFVLSWPKDEEFPEFVGLNIIKQANLGDIQVVFFGR